MAVVQFIASFPGPLSSSFAGSPINCVSRPVNGFFDVKAVDDLNGVREQFPRDVPDPRCAIANDHGVFGFGEAAAASFTQDAFAELGSIFIRVQSRGAFNRR